MEFFTRVQNIHPSFLNSSILCLCCFRSFIRYSRSFFLFSSFCYVSLPFSSPMVFSSAGWQRASFDFSPFMQICYFAVFFWLRFYWWYCTEVVPKDEESKTAWSILLVSCNSSLCGLLSVSNNVRQIGWYEVDLFTDTWSFILLFNQIIVISSSISSKTLFWYVWTPISYG